MAELNPLDTFLAEVDRQRFAIQAALLVQADALEDPAIWVNVETREQIARSKAVSTLGDILDAASLDRFTRELRAAALGNDAMRRAIDDVVGDLGSVRRIAIQCAPSTVNLDWQVRWLDLNHTIVLLRSHPVVPFVSAEIGNAAVAEPSGISNEATSTVWYLDDVKPKLCTYDDIEIGANLSRNTISKVVDELIEATFAHRPNGPRKGIQLTLLGLEFAKRVKKKL